MLASYIDVFLLQHMSLQKHFMLAYFTLLQIGECNRDCLNENPPSLHLLVFREILF